MRILTTSVIVMAVLIVAGSVALVFGILNRSSAPVAAPDLSTIDLSKQAFVRLGLPSGTEVRRISRVDQGLAILVRVPGQGDWIYVVPLSGNGAILKIAVSATGK